MRQLYKVEGKPRQEDAGEVSGLLFELVSYKQQLIAISADKHIPTPCPLQCADKNDVASTGCLGDAVIDRGNSRVWRFCTSITMRLLMGPSEDSCGATAIRLPQNDLICCWGRLQHVLQCIAGHSMCPSLTAYHPGIAAPCYVAALHCKKQGCCIARCCNALMISCCINA